MASIRQKKLKNGTTRYHAEIRINKKGFPSYREAKTFANKKIAQSWAAKREAELRDNPKLLFGAGGVSSDLTLMAAIDRYIDELGDTFGRSKMHALRLIQKFPIAQLPLTALSPLDLSRHATLRKNGIPELALSAIGPATLGAELVYLFGVLEHSEIMWGVDLDMNGLKRALKQLKKTRIIAPSQKRDRLPSRDELIKLTTHFYQKWCDGSKIPMHLVMWFAIYSARRQGEIVRLRLSDDLGECFVVRDVKNPKGSRGNHKKFSVSPNARTLIELLKTHASDGDYLVPVSPKVLSKSFTEACHLLGITDLHFHDLRHEACTRFAEAGLSIPQIQGYSLHDSWSSLARYVSVHRRGASLDFDEAMNAALDNRF